jgi:tetratricopeptide (TPR) repeat protein
MIIKIEGACLTMSDNVIQFPNLLQMYVNKAEAALQESHFEEAEKLLDQALKIDPQHIKAWYLYCLFLLQTERLSEVIQYIDDKREEKLLPAEWVESFQWIYEVAKQEVGSDSNSVNISVSPEVVADWKKGLQSDSFKIQWNTFDKMFDFIAEEVQQTIAEFLLLNQGDSLLKTKLLQKLKLNCPNSLRFEVKKEDQITTVCLADVPLEREDWSEEHMLPYQSIEDKAHDEPSIVQMAQEVWVYFLEKHYPFIPQIGKSLKWTAALHFYTLKLVDESFADSQLGEKFVYSYQFSEEEIREHCQFFERLLLRI